MLTPPKTCHVTRESGSHSNRRTMLSSRYISHHLDSSSRIHSYGVVLYGSSRGSASWRFTLSEMNSWTSRSSSYLDWSSLWFVGFAVGDIFLVFSRRCKTLSLKTLVLLPTHCCYLKRVHARSAIITGLFSILDFGILLGILRVWLGATSSLAAIQSPFFLFGEKD